jgi:hypothetical protein
VILLPATGTGDGGCAYSFSTPAIQSSTVLRGAVAGTIEKGRGPAMPVDRRYRTLEAYIQGIQEAAHSEALAENRRRRAPRKKKPVGGLKGKTKKRQQI